MLNDLPWQVPASFAIAAGSALIASIPARHIGHRSNILDEVTHRSSHEIPVPRTGGLAILAGMLVSFVVMSLVAGSFSAPSLIALGSVAIIAAVSFIDDVITIPSIPRLLAHFAVAGGAIKLLGLELTTIALPYFTIHMPPWAGLIVATLFVAGFINFFNFMDGINGISVAQGLFGGVGIAIILRLGGSYNSVLIALGLAGACVGFAPFNFPKARMFMGDSGSTILGYVLAMLTLIGARRTNMPWVAYVLPLGIFIYDAMFTLIKRILRRENFLKAHREHHYQLLIRCGWSHVQVTSLQAGLMLLCTAGAVLYATGSEALRLAVLCGLLCVAAIYSVSVHLYFRKHLADTAPHDASE